MIGSRNQVVGWCGSDTLVNDEVAISGLPRVFFLIQILTGMHMRVRSFKLGRNSRRLIGEFRSTSRKMLICTFFESIGFEKLG